MLLQNHKIKNQNKDTFYLYKFFNYFQYIFLLPFIFPSIFQILITRACLLEEGTTMEVSIVFATSNQHK